MRLAVTPRVALTASVVALLAYLVIYPIVVVVLRGLSSPEDNGLSLRSYVDVFTAIETRRVIVNTVVVVLVAVSVSLVLGTASAWLVERTDIPFANALGIVPLFPLLVSPLVGAVGWVFLLEPSSGYVNVLLRALSGSKDRSGPLDLFTPAGVGWIIGLYAVPYVSTYLRAALQVIDGSLEEAARICGASTMKVVWWVTLPLVRPAILAAAVLALIVALSEFSIPTVVGTRHDVSVLSTEIYHLTTQFPAQPEKASALSTVLTVTCVLGLFLARRNLAGRDFAVVGGRLARARPISLGVWRVPMLSLMLLLLTLLGLLPLAAIVAVAVLPYWKPDPSLSDLTGMHFQHVLDRPDTWTAISNSLMYAGAAASLAVLIGFAALYLSRFGPLRTRGLLDYLVTLPLGVPATVIGVGYLFIFLRGPVVLYGTAAALVIAYLAKAMPLGGRALSTSLLQIKAELREAARVHGANELRALARIVAPLSVAGIGAAWWLMFIVMFREFAISVLLYTPSSTVVGVELVNFWVHDTVGTVAAFALLTFSIGLLVTIVVQTTVRSLTRTLRVQGGGG
jgi:iron(III) transport system permease protein